MASTPVARSPRVWPWLLAWLLLTVYFVTPPREVFDASLDRSNYATYAHFVATGAQWGADVIPMTGPYGFILYGHTYTPEVFWLRFFGDLILKGVFAALLLHLFRRAGPGAIRWWWLGVVVLMLPAVDDLFHDYTILLAGLALLAGFGEERGRWSWIAAVLLGFLALFKGTHLLTTAVVFGTVVLLGIVLRRPRALVPLALAYVGSVVGFWLLARQNPAHLAAYIRDVIDLSSGYNSTMGFDELPIVFGIGLVLASALVTLLVTVARIGSRSPRLLVALVLVAGFTFIKWKHGFLRADGHVYIFFTSASVLVATICLCNFSALLGPPPAPLTGARRRGFIVLLTVTAGIAIIGTDVIGAGLIGEGPYLPQSILALPLRIPGQLQRNARYLVRPSRLRATLEKDLARVRRDAAVPLMQKEIDRDPVDFFGYEQGLLLLNDLNYRPRPMGGGSFNVFTPRLQQINAAFMRDSARAPMWEVVKLATVDDRLASTDDPLTLLAVLQQFSPVLMQRDYVLFTRRADETVPAPPAVLKSITAHAGETVDIPDPGADRLLLFTLDAPLSLLGKLRAFVYRPPNLTARITSDYKPTGHTYNLKPLMMHSPAVLSPLLEDNSDILRIFGATRGNRVRTLRLDPAPGFASEEFPITFYTVPRPPAPKDVDVTELITYRRNPLYNRIPVSLVTQETGIRELNQEEPITIVHAPGSITWDLKPDDQQVIFTYGIYPAAYLNGNTDGVEFNVEVIWPPNDGRILFKHMLHPYTYVPDQGTHRARVFLPPFRSGAQLRIRTHPGPSNNGAYDQSYVARVQIKSGTAGVENADAPTLIPEQFNGLGVVPVGGKLPATSVAAIDGRPVYLIHAPDEVAVEVPTTARRIACEIGILPGAYTGDGNTDGVEFTFSSLAPGGKRTVFWTRFLNPLRNPNDRGPQMITVTLPKLPPGSQLIVTTDPGPSHDRSWDHSYIANVKFK